MANKQTILFTVIPRGVSLNSATTPVSIFVSPRLDGAHHLGAFPDWLNWTRHLRDDGLKLDLHCGANTQTFSINGAGLRPDQLRRTFAGDRIAQLHHLPAGQPSGENRIPPARRVLAAGVIVGSRLRVALQRLVRRPALPIGVGARR